MSGNHGLREATPTSLLQSLRDGSAGAITRLIVSLAAGLLLAAVASVMSYMLSSLNPRVFYGPGMVMNSYVRVSEEIAAICFLLCGIIYLAFLYWIWSRHRRQRGLWVGGILTVGIWVLAVALCVFIDETFTGEDEFLIAGVLCTAGAATLINWLVLYQRHSRGRTLLDETGIVDVRCPECQYRMVGLREARCPECGREYTLDELVGKQDYDALRRRSWTSDVPGGRPVSSTSSPGIRQGVPEPPPLPRDASTF